MQMYADSVNWVVFASRVIIDAHIGCMWLLEMHLDEAVHRLTDDKVHRCFTDLCCESDTLSCRVQLTMLNFLLNRADGKTVLLQQLKQHLLSLKVHECAALFANIVDASTLANTSL